MQQSTWAIFLDLDQTLVITAAIEQYRKNRQWLVIHQYFNKTSLPDHTKAFLERVRPHFQLGVITASPRKYAEQLLAYHQLTIPVIAAYHDTKKHKPDPEPLLFAAKQLNISPARCIHIGDHQKDIIASHQAGMVAIRLSWENKLNAQAIATYPHTLCSNWTEVLTCLHTTVREG
ncbi:hypothetical protein ccbrp13_21630 [Ktedonobacteria bacterium brp13]|nr:hypothetical protein ccbrp13_21630 [Ktedonobacteria bacterium brp13]